MDQGNRDLTMRVFVCIFLLAALAGCAQREEVNPPPSSAASIQSVNLDAVMWAIRAPNRSIAAVAPSGSMLPLFGSNAILLQERSDGNDLTVGDIAVYQRGNLLVVHRVTGVYETNLAFRGDNNAGPDGLIAKSAVRSRVVGILYAQR